MNTQKKTYEKPFVEIFKAEASNRLLDWSAPKDNGPGDGNTVEIESKELWGCEWEYGWDNDSRTKNLWE